MYQHSFLFEIVSTNSRIEEILKKTAPLENCAYTFRTVPKVQEAAKDAPYTEMVRIYDGIDREQAPQAADWKNSVLLAGSGSALLTDPACIAGVEAVWAMPEQTYHEELLGIYFTHLAQRLKKRAEQSCDAGRMHDLNAEIGILLDNIPFAILVEDAQGIVLNKNTQFDKYFPEYTDLVGEESKRWKKSLNKRIILQDVLKEVVVQSGEQQRVLIYEEEPMEDGEKVFGTMITLMDITLERSIAEGNVQEANIDELTGLNNRRKFLLHLEEIHAREDYALIIVDMDDFKQINDTFGMEMGDRALLMATDLIKESFGDAFLARTGGDEFMIVESGKSKEQIQGEIEHMQGLLQMVCDRQQEFSGISMSIGALMASEVLEEDRDVHALMQIVNDELYRAKKQGKDCYCFYERADGDNK